MGWHTACCGASLELTFAKQFRHRALTASPYVSFTQHSEGGQMKFCRWLVASLFLAVVSPAWAQTDQGRVSGTVRDSTNAFVAGAAVSVKNERTGEERKG